MSRFVAGMNDFFWTRRNIRCRFFELFRICCRLQDVVQQIKEMTFSRAQ